MCAGIAKLKAHPTYGFLFPFFQRVRLEDANAFDINVAMVYPTTDAASDAYEAHYDVVFTKYLLDEAPVAGLTVRELGFVVRVSGFVVDGFTESCCSEAPVLV